ncbi:MAG: hypothetical protein HRT44_01695 [Bdellovibrionales bacterium]|nr:hypothetical protein [Bdellovibrionales bacterium]NQZ17959.1 hypothetical protein [Bdellovibrionales bacterium]
MKLLDRLGLNASRINTKLLKLVGDVETIDFSEILYTDGSVEKCIIVSHNVNLHDTYSNVNQFGLNYLVQSQHNHFIYNLIMAAIIIKFPDEFRKAPLPTIMRSTNQNKDQELFIPFDSSKEKSNVMGQVYEFIKLHPRLSSIENNIMLNANELFMNALYCAPTDEKGSPLYLNTERDMDVSFGANKKAEIYLSFNDNTLVVGCRDPYGSFNEISVKERLSQVFHAEKKATIDTHQERKGGSGLGLKIAIENSTGFGLVVKKNIESFVFTALPLGKGNKSIQSTAKNVFINFY